jgi:hypothetical protein
MNRVQEIDMVLQFVRQAAGRYGLPSDAALSQQILLLGDSFYGYRFASPVFTAVWSANDNTIKFFDRNGVKIANVSLSLQTPVKETFSIGQYTEEQPERKAA